MTVYTLDENNKIVGFDEDDCDNRYYDWAWIEPMWLAVDEDNWEFDDFLN